MDINIILAEEQNKVKKNLNILQVVSGCYIYYFWLHFIGLYSKRVFSFFYISSKKTGNIHILLAQEENETALVTTLVFHA